MPSTFFHAEAYAPVGTRGKANIYRVIGEACRDPGFCPHVANPLPPVVVWGVHPRDLRDMVGALRLVATDRGRCRLPATFPLMIGAVASLPVEPDEVDRDPDLRERVDAWIGLNVRFFIEEFGEALKSVVMHRDEENLHLHAHALPTPDPITHAVSVESIWRPLAAQGAARRNGGNRRVQREAFKAGAVDAQDRYHATVGQPADLERFGPDPDRRRRPRRAHLARRRAEEEATRRDVEIERRRAEVEEREAHLEAEAERLAGAKIQAVTRQAAEQFQRARRTALEMVDEHLALRAEVARLTELLREIGVDPNAAPRKP